MKDPEIIIGKKKRNRKENFGSNSTIVSPKSIVKSHPKDSEYFWQSK